MKSKIHTVILAALLVAPFVASVAWADAAEEVIALTKAQWQADMDKDQAGAFKHIADDYTEFNPASPVRVDGKELNEALYEANLQAEGETLAAEMANEHVQVYGDVAILTYNFLGVSKGPDGTAEPILAKSTRVYAREDGTWKLVHANFAPISGN